MVVYSRLRAIRIQHSSFIAFSGSWKKKQRTGSRDVVHTDGVHA